MEALTARLTGSRDRSAALGYVLLYLALGGLWILLSDQVLLLFMEDAARLTLVQTVKGWFYIGFTAVLLYTLIRQSTVRLRASEASLQQGNETFRALIEASPVAILLLDPGGRVRIWSPAAARLFGWAKEEAVGQSLAVVLPGEHEPLEAFLERTRQGEGVAGAPLACRHRDGTRVDVSLSTAVLRGRQGEAAGLVLMMEDVTERRAAEQAHRESQEHLRTVVTSIPLILFALDTDATVLLAEGSGLRRLGQTPGEAVGRSFFDVYSGYPEVTDLVRQAFAEEQMHGFVTAGPRTLECWFSRVLEAEAGAPRLIVVAVDVTESRRAEQALEQSEARVRAMLSAIPDMILRLSRNGLYLDVRAPLPGHLTGSPDQIVGRRLEELLPAASAPLYRTALEDALRTGMVQQFEYRLPGPSGRQSAYEVRLAPSGEEALALVRDVTARTEYEEALIRAKEEAEELARLKSAFLANMSHEIRTPLTSIIGFSEILREQIAGEEGQEFINLIYKSGQRLMSTLTSVLNLAQLESGTIDVVSEPIDLVEQTWEAAQLFRPQAEEQGLWLRIEPPAASRVLVMVDQAALNRILSNLLSNAIKFTERGGITLSVRVDDAWGEVQVRDTGIGMSAEFLEHIFREFKQESTGMARDYEGVGLGLSITKQLIELMGGTIGVQSEREQGSTFTVRLPRSGA